MIFAFPVWVELMFLVTTLATIVLFYMANGRPLITTIFIIAWAVVQSLLAYGGFYTVIDTSPPRLMFILIPIVLVMIFGLLPKQRRWFNKTRDVKYSTLLHTVRLPVEITLYMLFVNRMVPELMTFEGRNFDIIMGITAPVVAWLLVRNKMGRKALIAWNVIGLCLVLFIMVNGVLSAQTPFQQFAFDQPNRGIAYFPFVLLPAVIVPIVIWTHLSDLIRLIWHTNKGNYMD